MLIKNNSEQICEIPLTQIRDFPEHPYHVKDDDSMTELVESVKERGLLQPVIVRPLEEPDTYEMVSGHRRKRAYELAGMEKIPCRVLELTRDEAIIIMVESNFMRETILPSEKAFAYKMRLEAMKRMPGRPSKENGAPSEPNLSGLKSRDILADDVGESREQIRRYIRLNELIPDLLDMVDEGKIAMRPAVELSYLKPEEQEYLCEAMEYADATPSHYQAIRLREKSEDKTLGPQMIEDIMNEEKPNQHEKINIRYDLARKYIPDSIPYDKTGDFIMKALEFYHRHLERQRESER